MAEIFYIGMDLCSDFTQLSYYNDIKREPESVSQLNNKETYLMPNILFYSKDTEHWYVGGEASEARFNEDGIVFKRGQPEQQWIPCNERLPEDSSPVLITHRGGVSYGWYNGRYFERGANTNHRKLQTVIAWMPLPVPYQRGGEEDVRKPD